MSSCARTPAVAAAEQRGKHRRVDGLREVLVEAGLGRAPLVVGLTPARQRDQQGIGARRRRPDTTRKLVAIHVGQADIEQQDLRAEVLQSGSAPAPSGATVRCSRRSEQDREALGRVPVVVGDGHAPFVARNARRGRRRARLRTSLSGFTGRHTMNRAGAAPRLRASLGRRAVPRVAWRARGRSRARSPSSDSSGCASRNKSNTRDWARDADAGCVSIRAPRCLRLALARTAKCPPGGVYMAALCNVLKQLREPCRVTIDLQHVRG